MTSEHTIQETIKELEMLVEDYDYMKLKDSNGKEFANVMIYKDEVDNYRRLAGELKGMM